MDNHNAVTIDSYNRGLDAYLSNTRSEVVGDNKDWLDRIVPTLPDAASVLELGSTSGRDASYLEAAGFTVLCTDAAVAFVEHLRETGHNAQRVDVLNDELTGTYDLVIANMVLLHFEPDEIEMVLAKIRGALRPKGILAFSVRAGTGSGWSDDKVGNPRYYHYWDQTELSQFVAKCGFELIDMRRGDTTNLDKIYIIARQQ